MRTILLYLASLLLIAVLAFVGGRMHERGSAAARAAAQAESTGAKSIPESARPAKRTKRRPAKNTVPEQPETEKPAPDALIAAAAEQIAVAGVSQGGLVEVYRLIGQLQPADIPAALEEIAKLPHGKARQSLTAAVVARWAGTDGNAAIEYSLTELSHANRPASLTAALAAWSDSDAAGALSWYQRKVGSDEDFELAIGAKPIYLLPAIFQGLAAADIATAYASFSKLPTVEEKDQALDGIAAAGLTNKDTEYALELATSTLGEAGRAARLRLVTGWGERDPAAAAAWVSGVKDPTEKSQFAKSVAGTWIAFEPETAVPWLLANTMESERPTIVELATSIWVQSDANATARWLESLPKGKESDLGVATLARNIVGIDPEAAFGWAKTIASDRTRYLTMIAVISQWRMREPERSVESLKASGLPAEEIADYLNRTKPARQ